MALRAQALLGVAILVAVALAGCAGGIRTKSAPEATAMKLRDAAAKEARKWQADAVIVSATAMEVGLAAGEGAANPYAAQTRDESVGDGRSVSWMFGFSSASSGGKGLYVSIGANGILRATQELPKDFVQQMKPLDGWVIDSDAAARAIAAAEPTWTEMAAKRDATAMWHLSTLSGPAQWLATLSLSDSRRSLILTVDSKTGEARSFLGGFPTWRSGWANDTLTPAAGAITAKAKIDAPNHPVLFVGLRVTEPGAGGTLNLTVASPDGTTKLHRNVVVPPASGVAPGGAPNATLGAFTPAPGEWTFTVRSTTPTLQAYHLGWCAFGLPPPNPNPDDACFRAIR
ncbi:MAG: hypothetical protein HYT80_06480 [Euryarchaeota archaeon]|nr:hypothetical protein [Euryarchaeota archaeon]